ncbi:MAG TPA: DUF3826 domain-containing protein [Tepidisphaeraceae bacterium]|jgi:hypothetical protein
MLKFVFTFLLAMQATQPAVDEAAYTKMLDERVDKIVAALKLDDPAKAQAVHKTIADQYRAIRDIDDSKPKDQRAAAKTAIHGPYLAKLGENLTPAQVEAVKDGMTYGTVQVTYNAYLTFVPQLNEEQKAKILGWLKEAREEAMDGGSQKEKVAVFGKYKGRINNYLSSQGIDMKKQEQEYRDRQKAAKATQPAT